MNLIFAQNLAIAIAVNALISVAAFLLKTVNISGAVSGFLMGTVVFYVGGLNGYAILFTFFAAGSSATAIFHKKKHSIGTAQKKRAARNILNVLANGGVPAIILVAYYFYNSPVFFAAYVASLASATADTLESEIGVISKRPPRLLTSFQIVAPGTDGGVSILGTTVGFCAAVAIAALGYALNLFTLALLPWVALSGFISTLLESLIGAIFKTKGENQGHLLNFINTLTAAIILLFFINFGK